MGVRVTIASGFSDIFAGNAFKNGLLAIHASEGTVERLLSAARTGTLRVDLDGQLITTSVGDRISFVMDAFRKECLLHGLDEIGLTLGRLDAISRYEGQRPAFTRLAPS